MKAIKTLLLFASILAIVSFSSCKKDKKTPAPASGSMSATIDGTVIDFGKSTVVLTGSTNGADFTAIQGNAADGSSMSLTIYGTLTAGTTYTTQDPDPANEPQLLYVKGNDNYMNETNNPSVSIKITSVSTSSIQGTFLGSITDITTGANQGTVKVITEGKFDVPRQ
jgi:hypothetical protein